MPLLKIGFRPGIYKDDAALQAEGCWIDSNGVRFVRGLPESIYGTERASTTLLLGYGRGTLAWADNARNPFVAFGTNLRNYAMDLDGNITDITPWSSRTYISLNFTTTITSAVVTLGWTSHGLVVDQKFTLESASVATVGGVTIAGTYVVLTVVDANTVTFTAAQVATSSAGPTASSCLSTIYIAPGQADGLGGLGFGTGGYGSGGYASATSGLTFYPRTYSHAPWGQNLISNPRGGGIYETAPDFNATELVTNGTFTGSATGWTTGTGWYYGSNNIACTNATADLSQSITLAVGAWHRAVVNCTAYTSGGIVPKIATVAIGTTIQATGIYAYSFFSGGGGAKTLAFSPYSAALALDDISVQVQTYGNIITNAPVIVTCVFVTAERILVACGCADSNGNFDAMRVRWSDQQNNQTWTPTTSNLAGSYTLSNGSRIVRGLPGNRENIILTDTGLYAMRYVPDPNVVYSFVPIGSGCGLIGPNAVCEIGGVYYWMSPDGGFWKYDGSYPIPLRCTLGRDVSDHLAWVQQDKIYAVPMTVKGRLEVWFHIPDSRDGAEVSRYCAYQITESEDAGSPVWVNGTTTRTEGVNAGVFQYPVYTDTSGQPWFHEKGLANDGGPRIGFLKSAKNDLGDGNQHARINNYIADNVPDAVGGYTVQIDLYTKNLNGNNQITKGPYNVMTTSGKVNVRATGQEYQITYAWNTAPFFWRKGADAIDVIPMNRTR